MLKFSLFLNSTTNKNINYGMVFKSNEELKFPIKIFIPYKFAITYKTIIDI